MEAEDVIQKLRDTITKMVERHALLTDLLLKSYRPVVGEDALVPWDMFSISRAMAEWDSGGDALKVSEILRATAVQERYTLEPGEKSILESLGIAPNENSKGGHGEGL